MKKYMYAVMLLLGLSMTVSSFAQNKNLNVKLTQCRQQLAKDLANHGYDWLYGTWRLDFLNEEIVIDKDFVYNKEYPNNKTPFNLHYELEDPYNESLDYDVYLYIGNIFVDEDSHILFFADEFNIYPYEKISSPTISNNSSRRSFEGQEIFTIAEKMPQFPGGDRGLIDYLNLNIKYPNQARQNGIEGRVIVSFIVEPDGSLSNVSVKNGLGYGCDEEAIRVIQSMPQWEPGQQRGNPVRVAYTLPINFKNK